MKEVLLPELGEGISKACVTCWLFEVGQELKEGEDLVELTTDKATFNLPSPCSGILRDRLVNEGDNVNVGEVLAIIEEK
ncbi:MAG: biotin attachment protein [Candidatus Omnitrophica bacterium]|nr:biotin attachment protein [Candidatus Omnitrophota bacterium]